MSSIEMTLTVHHLQVSQSERITWLCEELDIPYEIVLHERAPTGLSPQSILDINPLGQAPVIQDGEKTLAESAACVEYIIQTHGQGNLVLSPLHKNYSDYLYWFHFANGNFQPLTISLLYLSFIDKSGKGSVDLKVRYGKCLNLINSRLENNTWLAGDEFTAADIMIVYTLTTMRTFYSYSLEDYPFILAYLKRAVSRPGYKKARAKGDPNLELMIDAKPPLHWGERMKAEGKM